MGPDPFLRQLIQRCLELLPERPRLAIQARITARGGRTDHELSADSGMKLNTFLQNVRRARIGLERCLAEQGHPVVAGGTR